MKLKQEKELNYSAIPKKLLNELLQEDLVSIKTISSNKKKVIITKLFLEQYKDIEKLEDVATRSNLTKLSYQTKSIKISPQDGLYISGDCIVDNVKLPLFNLSAIFLKQIPKIAKDTLVVGVENYENLIYFESTLKYFQSQNILFVYRNQAMMRLFKDISNKIIYFGDFDLAGIEIYLKQILPINSNIKLFIPSNLDILIKKYGNNYLYKKQINRYSSLKSEDQNIQNIIDTIHKYQKCLEQEFFICNNK
jgi:hypothetical protein